MTISARPLAVTIFIILFGGILLANGFGWWNTENQKRAAVYRTGEFAGQPDPADIRGSYTFGDVQNNFDIPASVLAEAFGIVSDDPENFPVKSLESLYAASAQQGYEIGTASVRLFVAFYKGYPFSLTAHIYLPTTAAQILATRPLDKERADYLAAHTVIDAAQPGTVVPSTAEPNAAASTPLPESHEPNNQYMVRGKTTFDDVITWGVAPETIEAVMGMPMPAAMGMLIRDFCSANGLAFETVKTALQAEVERVRK